MPLLQLFYANTCNIKTAVEPGHTMSEYARNVAALCEMKHKTAGLFEPSQRQVSGCRVTGHSERLYVHSTAVSRFKYCDWKF